jgi:putative oxidoreductase
MPEAAACRPAGDRRPVNDGSDRPPGPRTGLDPGLLGCRLPIVVASRAVAGGLVSIFSRGSDLMQAVQGIVSVMARVMIAVIFLASAGMNKIPNFSGVAEGMAGKGIPLPKVLLAGAIAFLILGSVSLILGFKARWGALLLLIFLAAATYYFHDFWRVAPEQRGQELTNFLKNFALMGTMLFFIANGAGPWSLDARLAASDESLEEAAA